MNIINQYFIIMSSFLFEKDQINCQCFDNSPKEARRIFRTQSHHSSSVNNKESKQLEVRPDSQQGKHKKKSLKKEKPASCSLSQRDAKQKQQLSKDIFAAQIPIILNSNQNKKQQRITAIECFSSNRFQVLKTQRSKPPVYLRNNRAPSSLIPQLWQPNQYIPATIQTQKIIRNTQELLLNDFDKLVSEQFQKDLQDFKHLMEEKQKEDQQITRKKKGRKQSLCANKISLQNLESFEKILHLQAPQSREKVIACSQIEKTPLRSAASYRNSAINHRQKESISKRIKGKMLPKQIQSQKDGSSSESDNISQVVGRGWDGLTQQKIELQQLDEMIEKQKYNAQTMVTQQSHIKNSQIKTLTQYSNSIISPKSQYTKGIGFGGGNKYGIAGMSYQHIDNLGKTKNYSYNKIHF